MKPPTSPSSQVLRRRELVLLGGLLLAMTTATGVGVPLVNRAVTVLGFPLIYIWGVVWYFILGGLAVAMDRLVWRHDGESQAGEAE